MTAPRPGTRATVDDAGFRLARRSDLADLLRLYAQLGTDEPTPPARAVDAVFAALDRGDIEIWCRTAGDDTPVATCTLALIPNLAHAGAGVAVLENVVTDAAHRGRGHGRACLLHAVGRARAAGCYKLALSSNRTRTRALRFYQDLGLRLHGYSLAIDPDADGS